jgi:general secretion pathway protein M
VLGSIILFWGLIWSPLSSRTAELTEAVGAKQRTLTTLQRARSLSNSSGMQIDPSARQSLVLLVDQTHRSYGLEGSLVRNQPDGADGIRVTFQDAGFDGLIAWLGALHAGYGVLVESATIDSGRLAGVVNATVVLRRS